MPAPQSLPLRVLVAEPDATRRTRLRSLLNGNHSSRMELLSNTNSTADETFDAILRLRPSIALLSASQPAFDVLGLAERVMAQCPTPLLVLIDPPGDSDLAARWIEAGVLDTVACPTADATSVELEGFGEDLCRHLELLAGVRVVRHIRRANRAGVIPTTPPRYLGIVASTGGPPAVSSILRALGPSPSAAVLVVQHIGQQFAESLAEWFGREAPMPFGIARDGEVALPGHAYLAPANSNLTVESGRLRVRRSLDKRHAPGDALLASLAREAPVASVGVVLTGIGSDGSEGMLALRRGGGVTVAQDRDSSAVWGMPQVCVESGAASEVLSLTGIAVRLSALFTPRPFWRAR
jgi:two-component system chemotaxis response regulator CheB